MQFPVAKIDPKIEYQRKKDKARKEAIDADISRIDDVIANGNEGDLKALHREIDSKYQTCIANWGQSMYGYNENQGFKYESLSEQTIKDNLFTMKAKLLAFDQGWNAISSNPPLMPATPDVNVTVNNTVNISVSFEEARKRIEDMTALNREQTDDIIDKINELERIQKESSSRKNKWEKVKPIIYFALDKGADVAIALLSLVVKMQLGS